MKNSIVLDKNQGKITFNEYEIQMHKEVSVNFAIGSALPFFKITVKLQYN